MGSISDFVAAFGQERDRYFPIEKDVEALCKKALRGIEFLWQSRVKATESLETKLRDRMQDYKAESENVADVKDLVAGRIILARWLDFEHVEKVVGQTFNVRGRAQHPKHGQNTVNLKARFRGYDGLHFHVTLRDPLHQRSCNPIIEIQVMSAFMWGFLTLEHDVEYKRLHGLPDEDLLLSLEMLKGIANMGEIALQMYDRHIFPVANLYTQQYDTHPDLQSSVRTLVASVGLGENDKKCLRDLGSDLTDPRDDRKRIERHKDGLVEGLCSWVFENPAFVDWWTHDDCRFLWIHGDPGKGKTMMMMAIIDEVIERLRERAGSNVLAYFFCENTNSKLNTTVSVLRGLIFQLVDQEKTLISHLRKKYDSKGAKMFEDENALDVLLELLSDILNDQSLGAVYFMVDALDECDTEIHELLQRIVDESFKVSPKVKWLTTSRNEPAFVEQLGHQRHTSLELNSSRVTRSVATFIDHKINELTKMKSYASELKESLRISLLEKSEGTFLWVALVCRELRKVRKQHAKSLLEEMPAGLKPLYARMMNKVLSQDRQIDVELCRQILCSVTLAIRPLRLEEIVVFAKIPEEYYKDLSDLKELVSLCGSFITIREGTVYLVHQSARDFLSDRERKDIFPLGREHEDANTARLCLEVMSSTLNKHVCDFKLPGICLSDIDNGKIMTHLPVHVQYACLYWFDHLKQASPLEQVNLVSREDCQVPVFFKRHFFHWLEALRLMNETSKALSVICSVMLASHSVIIVSYSKVLYIRYADIIYASQHKAQIYHLS